ncbi:MULTISPECIES: hypothetical protein [Burkholderia]|uniref:hypothetical protein n=1 Tax=Burkholderia TaxID=32008 RepID=UPI00265DD7ED|nr:hypothetical protein [Burkholderia sp. AU44665]MDN7701597.1 hypothetical protein [Burkholderia sp. AU44665]
MTNRKFAFVILLCVAKISVAGAGVGAVRDEETLCRVDEDIYFSCPLANEKVISICAKNNYEPGEGYIKYRYGRNDGFLEILEGHIGSGNLFSISDVSEGSIRGLHLKITNGAYVYVVSSVWPGGVYVSRNGRVIMDQECRSSKYKNFSDNVSDGVKWVLPSEVDVH